MQKPTSIKLSECEEAHGDRHIALRCHRGSDFWLAWLFFSCAVSTVYLGYDHQASNSEMSIIKMKMITMMLVVTMVLNDNSSKAPSLAGQIIFDHCQVPLPIEATRSYTRD